jgi:hypothetical protein
MIIAPSKSFDKCWFCCNILSRIEEYSDADEVLKRYKERYYVMKCNAIMAQQREIKIIFHLMARLSPQISDSVANRFQVQFHVKAFKLWFARCSPVVVVDVERECIGVV